MRLRERLKELVGSWYTDLNGDQCAEAVEEAIRESLAEDFGAVHESISRWLAVDSGSPGAARKLSITMSASSWRAVIYVGSFIPQECARAEGVTLHAATRLLAVRLGLTVQDEATPPTGADDEAKS